MSRTAALRRRVRNALKRGDHDKALRALRDAMAMALRAASRDSLLCHGSPEIDALCLDVGRPIAGNGSPTASPEKPQALDLFVASELYATGGHTGLLGDYLRACSAGRLLAVTRLLNGPLVLPESVYRRLGIEPDKILMCGQDSLAKKCRWLIDLIRQHRPRRVFLFTHFHDSAAIAACVPLDGVRYHFIHHADHLPSLGAFRKDFLHIDLTPFCFACCRQAHRGQNHFLPLSAEDQDARIPAGFDERKAALLTAACGSATKFELERSTLYGESVATILKTTGGRHLHIGDLSPAQLRAIHGVLRRHGDLCERFEHVPFVPSLWRALADRVDLYIGSLPQRGARASVEAMGSGTPAIWHVASEDTRFHDTHMKYPEAEVWRTQDELAAILAKIDGAWLGRQSAAARTQYEAHHHPRLLVRQLAAAGIDTLAPAVPSTGAGRPLPVPFDALQISWRDRLYARLIATRTSWRGRSTG
ncbi:MAG TPA: hypothetical protein VGJ31_14210 [Dongiaceae bacterium]